MLESFGCTVDIACNGEVALEMYQNEEYDIVLMDCQMPVMDGYEATRHIRRYEAQRSANERIPIVAITAGKTEVEKDRCYGAGMDRILFKPYSTAELNAVLAQYFEPVGEVAPPKPASKRPPPSDEDILDLKALDNIRSVEVQTGNSLLAKVFDNFKEDVALKIEQLRKDTDDPKALGAGAHAIASMSLNLGAKALAAYCRKREADWKNRLLEDVHREIEVLQGHFTDAMRALEPIVRESSEQLES
jgi:CheY-like chemotaxis protein